MAIKEQFIEQYKTLTPEQQTKIYDAGNAQVKSYIDAYNKSLQPAQQVNTGHSPDIAHSGSKTPQQPKPQQPAPQQPTQPQSTYTGHTGPVELKDIQGSDAGTQLYKGYADYQDASQQRLNEIASNIRSYYTTSPEIFSSYDTYKNFFSYSDRIDQQKIVLDSFWQAKTQGEGLSSKSVSDLLALYSGGNIGTSDLQRLQQYNPSKYADLMAMISKQGDMEKYDSMLNGQAVNPFQSIIDAYSQNMLTMISAPTNMFAEYKEAMNSTTMKEYGNQLAEKEGEIKDIDLQLNSIKRDVEERYKGTGATRSKINAIIADESWKLSETRNRLAIEYQTLAQKYNNEMTSVRNDFELQLQEYQFNMQQQQQQMQQLGFMMQLVNFETNAQKDEREWQNFIRQQEYADGNIYSSDPATRRKAVSKAVDNILQEFAGIPMVRSREQMIEDIWNLVEKQGMSLGDAITKNIREPIMQKPEYISWKNQKFGTGAPDLYNIGGQQMTWDSATNTFQPVNVVAGFNFTGSMFGDVSQNQELLAQNKGQTRVANNNPTGITYGASKSLEAKRTAAGIQFEKGTARPSSEGGHYYKFATLDQGIEAYKISLTDAGYDDIYSRLYKWVGGDDAKKNSYALSVMNNAGLQKGAKFSQLTEQQMNALMTEHLRRESPGLYKYMQGAGVGAGGIEGEIFGFDPTLASMYNKYTSGKNLTKTDWEAIMSTGVSQAQFMAQAQNYKAEEDKRLIPLVKNTLEDIDFLLNANIDYADWVNMNIKTPGTKGRNYRNYIEKIISSAALANLIDLKSQGATFGALSDNELNFITQSSINLDVGTSLKTVKENLQKYKDLLTKGIDTAGGVAGQQTTQQKTQYGPVVLGFDTLPSINTLTGGNISGYNFNLSDYVFIK